MIDGKVPSTSAPGGAVRELPPEAYVRMVLVLRVGLAAAVAILLGSIIAFAIENPGASLGSILAANPVLRYLGVTELAAGLAAGSVPAYLTLGVAVLIATPLVRVLSGMYYFQRGGERTLTAITLTVFLLLLLGLFVIGPLVR
jgi:uncharacterized membrane protein